MDVFKWFRRSKPAPFVVVDPVDIVLHVKRDELYLHALDLVAQHEVHNQEGEWKRHQVFARLVKDFPLKNKNEIGLVIEAANQEVNG